MKPKLANPVVLRNSIYNLLGLGLPLLVAIITIPMLLAELGVSKFGLLTLVWAVVSYFGVFDLGLGRAVTQRLAIAVSEDRQDEFGPIVGTATVLMLGLGVLAGVIMALVAPLFFQDVKSDVAATEVRDAIFWMAIGMPAIVLTSCYRGILEAAGRFGVVNLIRLPMGIFTFVGPLAGIALGFGGLDSLAAILVLGRIIACVLHAWFAIRSLPGLKIFDGINRAMMRPLLVFGGWLSVSNVVSPAMGYADRFIIGILLSSQAVAYFVTPQEMVTKLSIVPMALSAVLFPIFSQMLITQAGEARGLILRYWGYLSITVLPVAIIAAVFANPLLTIWIDASFAVYATVPMQIFCLGVAMNAYAHITSVYLQARGDAKLTALIHVAEALPYLLILYICTSRWGIAGAAWAWAGRMVIDTIAVSFFALRKSNASES